MSSTVPVSIDATLELLKGGDYIADRSLATVLYLALKLGRPLFCEGEAGVGKTEIAKVLSATLKRPLIRLQCYEGLDVASAVYEWNYARQMIEIRLAEAQGVHDRGELASDIFDERFLIRRPLLEALEPHPEGAPILLIDEPTEGLAPLLVEQVGVLLAEIASRGVAILLVEQKLTIALKISHRLYVMGHGKIVFEGTPADLSANADVRREWLEV